LEGQWKGLRRGWHVGGDRFAATMRDKIGRLLQGNRSESHSGAAKREHGEQAAGQLLRRGLEALGLGVDELAGLPRTAAQKAALAVWLRERSAVSLRWVSERLQTGNYTNASPRPRNMRPARLRQYQQAMSKLAPLDATARRTK